MRNELWCDNWIASTGLGPDQYDKESCGHEDDHRHTKPVEKRNIIFQSGTLGDKSGLFKMRASDDTTGSMFDVAWL